MKIYGHQAYAVPTNSAVFARGSRQHSAGERRLRGTYTTTAQALGRLSEIAMITRNVQKNFAEPVLKARRDTRRSWRSRGVLRSCETHPKTSDASEARKAVGGVGGCQGCLPILRS